MSRRQVLLRASCPPNWLGNELPAPDANDGELHEQFKELITKNVFSLLAASAVEKTIFAVQAAEGGHHCLVISRSGLESLLKENFGVSIDHGRRAAEPKERLLPVGHVFVEKRFRETASFACPTRGGFVERMDDA